MQNEKQKTVLTTRTYTITVQEFEDGTETMCRRNDGFSALELLGLADFIAIEIREQIMGRIVPNTIKREVVVHNSEKKPNENN